MEISELKGKTDIKKMIEKKDVDGLIKALKDENVRMRVAEALGKIGKQAVEPLINAHKDEYSDVWSFVKKTLEKIRQK